jgi:hypothetical protein
LVLEVLLVVSLALLWLCVLSCAVALAWRLRRSSGLQRRQLKWLAAAGVVQAVLLLLSVIATELAATLSPDPQPAWLTALDTFRLVSFALLPAAIGVAILRHRLYDLDVVINRALVYGTLTAILGGVYLGSVLLLQLTLAPVTDQSDLAVAVSTLTVAALFRPGVRASRPVSTVASTAAGTTPHARWRRSPLGCATRSSWGSVSTDLRDVVEQTVQPVHVSLWLRP